MAGQGTDGIETKVESRANSNSYDGAIDQFTGALAVYSDFLEFFDSFSHGLVLSNCTAKVMLFYQLTNFLPLSFGNINF